MIETCAQASLAGTIVFPEVVRRLQAIGLERRHGEIPLEPFPTPRQT